MSLTGKNVYKYVCIPNNITIIAEDGNINRRLNVTLYVNEKDALYGSYSIADYTQDEANEKVKTFCNGMLMFTEDEIQDWVEEDKVMLALNAYRRLQQVRTTAGNFVWSRS